MSKSRIGEVHGYLEIKKSERRKDNKGRIRTYYYCHCKKCGNNTWIRSDMVVSGKQISCGCMQKETVFKSIDLTNKVFGRLTALEPTNERDKYNGSVIWKCKCECGNIKYAPSYLLEKNSVTSCGCRLEEVRLKRGEELSEKTKEFCIEGTNVRNLTMKIPKHNTSGIKGVIWDSARNKWVAQIIFKGKKYYLGRYADKIDAIKIRDIAEEKIYGEFLKWYEEEYKSKKIKTSDK